MTEYLAKIEYESTGPEDVSPWRWGLYKDEARILSGWSPTRDRAVAAARDAAEFDKAADAKGPIDPEWVRIDLNDATSLKPVA